MGFFLLGKRRDDSGLQLIADVLYATRQDAIDALSAINVPSELDSEVFVVDLDTATPVVVVQKRDSQDAHPVADETPEPVAEEVVGEDEGLHHALKGAAASLEGEGISAPDSIGPVDEDSALPDTPVEPAGVAEGDKAWPWAPGETPADESAQPDEGDDLEEAIAQSAPVDEYVPDPLEEPAVAVGEMVATPGVEDVDASQPVIMGTYRDDDQPKTPDGVVITDEPMPEPEFDSAPEVLGNEKARNDLETVLADLEIPEPVSPPAEPAAPAEPPVAADPGSPVELEPFAEEVAAVEPAEAVPAASEVADLMAQVDTEPAQDEDAGFEAGGSDLADLTCDDCVYMNTCPKKGESDPSSCGSFQWKSS